MTVAEGSDDDQPDPQMLRQIMCVPGRRARHEWAAQRAAFVPTVEGLTFGGSNGGEHQTAVSSASSGRGKVSRPTAASTSSRA
jgi:hypothetical protein